MALGFPIFFHLSGFWIPSCFFSPSRGGCRRHLSSPRTLFLVTGQRLSRLPPPPSVPAGMTASAASVSRALSPAWGGLSLLRVVPDQLLSPPQFSPNHTCSGRLSPEVQSLLFSSQVGGCGGRWQSLSSSCIEGACLSVLVRYRVLGAISGVVALSGRCPLAWKALPRLSCGLLHGSSHRAEVSRPCVRGQLVWLQELVSVPGTFPDWPASCRQLEGSSEGVFAGLPRPRVY